MRVIYVATFWILGLTFAIAGEATPAPDLFQATIRGDGTSGVVVFRSLDAAGISGEAVLFYQGNKFSGPVKGRVESGSKLVVSFDALGKAATDSGIQSITGVFETPILTPPRNCASGSGLLTFIAGNSKSAKVPGSQNIKVQVFQAPVVSKR